MAGKKLINRWDDIVCVSEHNDFRWHSLNMLRLEFNNLYWQPWDGGGWGPWRACDAPPWSSTPPGSSGGRQGKGDPAALVKKDLHVITFGSLSQIDERMLIQIERGKVALISGGGSGHEPFCAGYIGETPIDTQHTKHQAKTYQNYSSKISVANLGF